MAHADEFSSAAVHRTALDAHRVRLRLKMLPSSGSSCACRPAACRVPPLALENSRLARRDIDFLEGTLRLIV